MQFRRGPLRKSSSDPKHPWFTVEGTPKHALDIAPEVKPDSFRLALGWLLYHPQISVLRRNRETGGYRVEVDGNVVSPEVPREPIVQGLILIGMLLPAPDDYNNAVGNPGFLKQNPLWGQMYIPDPKKARRKG